MPIPVCLIHFSCFIINVPSARQLLRFQELSMKPKTLQFHFFPACQSFLNFLTYACIPVYCFYYNLAFLFPLYLPQIYLVFEHRLVRQFGLYNPWYLILLVLGDSWPIFVPFQCSVKAVEYRGQTFPPYCASFCNVFGPACFTHNTLDTFVLYCQCSTEE